MAQSINLTTWMSDLPESLKKLPIIYLAIPGSHDSMTYGITKKSSLAPDTPPELRRLWPLFRGTVFRWSKTQNANITKQLESGIRYFDLRLATKVGTRDLYFTHTLYADEVSSQFNELKNFLDTYQNEIVILDCQHFYEFQVEDHKRLFGILVDTFGLRICPPQKNLEAITLESMNRQRQQVIIIYRNNIATASPRFWRSDLYPNPWPDKTSPREVLNFLKWKHRDRAPTAGFVTQAIITPSLMFILLRLTSDVLASCAKPISKVVVPWISTLLPGPPPPRPTFDDSLRVNVVIADFVDLNDYSFPKIVIGLNYKLLTLR